MVCGICKLDGHNRRTCTTNRTVKNVDDYTINNVNTITNYKTDIYEKCIICFTKNKYPLITPCNHTFCSKCIFKNISLGNFKCPLCRKNLIKNVHCSNRKCIRKLRRLQSQVRNLKTEKDYLMNSLHKKKILIKQYKNYIHNECNTVINN